MRPHAARPHPGHRNPLATDWCAALLAASLCLALSFIAACGQAPPAEPPYFPHLNRAPLATADSVVLPYEGATDILPLANDSDPDGDSFFLLGAIAPGHGHITVDESGVIHYQAQGSFAGSDPFRYVISDQHGSTDSGTIVVLVHAPGNLPPQAENDSFTIEDFSNTDLDVLANDTDPNGADQLTIISVTAPMHGQAGIVDGGLKVRYTAPSVAPGVDSFGYTVSDGHGGEDEATVLISVRAP